MSLNFVGNCLGRRKLYMQISDAFITSFKLCRDGIYGVHATKTVDYWLRFAIQSKEKELDLTVRHFFFVSSFVMQVH